MLDPPNKGHDAHSVGPSGKSRVGQADRPLPLIGTHTAQQTAFDNPANSCQRNVNLFTATTVLSRKVGSQELELCLPIKDRQASEPLLSSLPSIPPSFVLLLFTS